MHSQQHTHSRIIKIYRKTVYNHIKQSSSFSYLDKLAGNLDTQTVEYKQLLGTDSELENSVRVGHFGTLTTTYENRPKEGNYESESTYMS